jgi:hypothetical protein
LSRFLDEKFLGISGPKRKTAGCYTKPLHYLAFSDQSAIVDQS